MRAGAFTRSLARGGGVGMLLSHVGGRTAGHWTTIRENRRGLFVRGLVSDETASAARALRMIAREGLDGLSSGFVARDWSPRAARGRELKEVELREISLVAAPMLPGARFAAVGEPFKIRVLKASYPSVRLSAGGKQA